MSLILAALTVPAIAATGPGVAVYIPAAVTDSW
jgi:hypothetical protein